LYLNAIPFNYIQPCNDLVHVFVSLIAADCVVAEAEVLVLPEEGVAVVVAGFHYSDLVDNQVQNVLAPVVGCSVLADTLVQIVLEYDLGLLARVLVVVAEQVLR
jgi:hypothetical protein